MKNKGGENIGRQGTPIGVQSFRVCAAIHPARAGLFTLNHSVVSLDPRLEMHAREPMSLPHCGHRTFAGAPYSGWQFKQFNNSTIKQFNDSTIQYCDEKMHIFVLNPT